MACQFRGTAPLTAILLVVHASATPPAAAVRRDQAPASVKVSVCIPQALVEDWAHHDPESAAFDPAAPDPRGCSSWRTPASRVRRS